MLIRSTWFIPLGALIVPCGYAAGAASAVLRADEKVVDNWYPRCGAARLL